MRAAVFRSTGPAAEVLRVEEVPTPEPGPGQVRVRIVVSGVNPTDWKNRSGAVPVPGGVDFQVPNQDGAGVIDKVGPGVDASRVGERVWLYLAAWQNRYGTAGEYTVLPQERAVALPDGVSFDLGANLGVPAMTAHRCLFVGDEKGGLSADGDPTATGTVLVHGGAGAVGHFAIELARAAGVTVISTVSGPEKAELATAAGAHHVVNYRDADAADQIRAIAPGGVDRIIEVNLASNLDLDVAVAAQGASIVTYAADARKPELSVRELMTRNLVLRFMLLYSVPEHALRRATTDITALLPTGGLTALPAHRFTLDETAAAHDAVEAGAVGKVLIDL
jgi:NADPH2:quinone reductase